MVRQTLGSLSPMRHLGGSCSKREWSVGFREQTREGKDIPVARGPGEHGRRRSEAAGKYAQKIGGRYATVGSTYPSAGVGDFMDAPRCCLDIGCVVDGVHEGEDGRWDGNQTSSPRSDEICCGTPELPKPKLACLAAARMPANQPPVPEHFNAGPLMCQMRAELPVLAHVTKASGQASPCQREV
jgi:hypothetical protein